MRNAICITVMLLVLAGAVLSDQEAPVGMPINPLQPKNAPEKIKRLIPKRAALRVFSRIDSQHSLLVYDAEPGTVEPRPHILILKDHTLDAEFDLEKISEYGENYTAAAAAPFMLAEHPAVAVAFRNVGDGSGTIFTIFAKLDRDYERVLVRRVSEGQLRLKSENLELWSAAIEDNECTWCPHHYRITTFSLKGNTMVEVTNQQTKKKVSPSHFAGDPLHLNTKSR